MSKNTATTEKQNKRESKFWEWAQRRFSGFLTHTALFTHLFPAHTLLSIRKIVWAAKLGEAFSRWLIAESETCAVDICEVNFDCWRNKIEGIQKTKIEFESKWDRITNRSKEILGESKSFTTKMKAHERADIVNSVGKFHVGYFDTWVNNY